ncbi:hypothetical protein L207DRAFT_2314 [Hyaloscypha variabilis F]|uniref:Uncharacterized protein n=1 Tax=Hyaloscypha variabilis (strain UAMH 11265 / GT02V1 / F) TaxID=1149755 RepID=A0A2J6SBP3_HYAVF|nr:hypothetical protein L207DRAFT_2314 [Hyaloscypha variabilis F]
MRTNNSSALWRARLRMARVCKRADEGVVFFPESMEGEKEDGEDVVARWQREYFAVREESMEERVERIRRRVAELTGAPAPSTATTTTVNRKEESENRAMWNVLGYSIKETGDQELDREILELHRRRMEDVLGPGVLEVKRLCEERGVWCSELGTREFRVLVMNFDDQGVCDWAMYPWNTVEENVRKRIAGVGMERREEDGIRLEAIELLRQVGKSGMIFRFADGLSAEEMLRRARVKMELLKEGKLRSVEEQMASDPAAVERFRAMMAGKEALGSPKEMRDMAEESVGRVKTGDY